MAERQRGVVVELDPSEGLEHGRAGADRHLVLVDMCGTVVALEPMNTDPARLLRGRGGLIGGAHAAKTAVWGSRTVSRVRQGSSTPSFRQTTSAHTSAMPRSVVRLAAGDRDEPLDAVVHGVVDRLEGPRELAARVGVVLGADQRPGGRPRRAERRVADGGDQLRALLDHASDVVLGNAEVVGVLDHPGAGADDRERPLRDHDVAVARADAAGSPPCCRAGRAPRASRRGRAGSARRPRPCARPAPTTGRWR